MFGVPLRLIALTCFMTPLSAFAQDRHAAQAVLFDDAAAVYQQNQEDVTLPVATGAAVVDASTDAVTVPTENLATPMRCMTAWSYLAGRIIERPELLRAQHPDFTEASASAHWQHWLKQDLDAHQGVMSPDFHARRLAAERSFSLSLANEEETYAFRTLGSCHVAPEDREIGDPTLLLRNFMIAHQGLPETYTVPVLQRQLRAFPLTTTVDEDAGTLCDAEMAPLSDAARVKSNLACFDRGGILASQTKVTVEDINDTCQATAVVQCENIP